ncbi:MAG: hypothetical protein VX761_00390 [Planctomycetota bacterium]|nr:hypothetical protein [Planctomycetota bacterium]
MLEYYLGGVNFMAKNNPQNDLLEVKRTARRHNHNRRGSLN